MLNLAEQSERSNQAENVKCFISYPPISCSTGNHVSQFNARHIFLATYTCFLISPLNQLLLHSFIMRHPWSCCKFYQVWLLSPPFCSVLGNVHYLAYSMELSGSVRCQLEYWKHNSEVPFICVLSIVHMHYRLHSLMRFCKLTLDFFCRSQNLRRLVLKCCLFSQSLQEHVEWGWFVHTNSWLCFCCSTSVLLCFILRAWFWHCMI